MVLCAIHHFNAYAVKKIGQKIGRENVRSHATQNQHLRMHADIHSKKTIVDATINPWQYLSLDTASQNPWGQNVSKPNALWRSETSKLDFSKVDAIVLTNTNMHLLDA